MGTPIDRDKMRSIGVISRRTKPRVREGREHPDSGLPYRSTTDELGGEVTEHGKPGSGVSQRQDVNVHPKAVQVKIGVDS